MRPGGSGEALHVIRPEYPAKSLRDTQIERTATGNIIFAEDKARLSGSLRSRATIMERCGGMRIGTLSGFLRSVPVGGSGVTPSGAWGGIK